MQHDDFDTFVQADNTQISREIGTPDHGVWANNTLAVGGYLDPYRLSKTT